MQNCAKVWLQKVMSVKPMHNMKARANRIATHVQLILAQEQLAQIIGPYRKMAVSATFNFKSRILPIGALALCSQNLSIQQARIQQHYAEDQKRVEQAALYPQIEAVGTYGYAKQSPQNVISSDGQFDQIGVEMNWNVYNGGRRKIHSKAAVKKRSSVDRDS